MPQINDELSLLITDTLNAGEKVVFQNFTFSSEQSHKVCVLVDSQQWDTFMTALSKWSRYVRQGEVWDESIEGGYKWRKR